MRVVIADPDAPRRDLLSFAAARRGHQSFAVAKPQQLFDRLPFEPSVVVVALSGDDADFELVQTIRDEFSDIACYVTLERPQEPVPARFLQAGATDTVQAPYNPNELVLRAEGWLAAKGSAAAVSDVLRLADLEIALDRYTAKKNGQPVVLTKLELRLLYCLCEHHPHLAPLERLLTFGWDTLGDPDAALIKTHISHIRKKLREAGGTDIEITSRQTIGYVLSVPGLDA
jgi:two-component system phosphate regulon response regulator PhoB